MTIRATAATALLALMTMPGANARQADAPSLYDCTEATTAEVSRLGVTICDAAPTAALAARATTENLQMREGALVVELETDGVSEVAGLQPGDVIYRVGGIDVSDAEAAAESLAGVGTSADTVVNFLRGGRPYRVKLRR